MPIALRSNNQTPHLPAPPAQRSNQSIDSQHHSLAFRPPLPCHQTALGNHVPQARVVRHEEGGRPYVDRTNGIQVDRIARWRPTGAATVQEARNGDFSGAFCRSRLFSAEICPSPHVHPAAQYSPTTAMLSSCWRCSLCLLHIACPLPLDLCSLWRSTSCSGTTVSRPSCAWILIRRTTLQMKG